MGDPFSSETISNPGQKMTAKRTHESDDSDPTGPASTNRNGNLQKADFKGEYIELMPDNSFIQEDTIESAFLADKWKWIERKPSDPLVLEKVAPSGIMEAPVFRPTPEEFEDPFGYLNNIYEKAEEYGICKVIPPPDWKPPFQIDSASLSFQPRVQPLALLEAKQRFWLMFHTKLQQYWSLYAMRMSKSITVRGVPIDLCEFYFMLSEEIKSTGSNMQQISLTKWTNIATVLGFREFDGKLATELIQLYENMFMPMENFTKDITEKVKKHQRTQKLECFGAARKRRMMAGASNNRRSMKKMMKTSISSSNTFVDRQTFNFDALNTARVLNTVCRKCVNRVSATDDELMTCRSCAAVIHFPCSDIGSAPVNDWLSRDNEYFLCHACVAYELSGDVMKSFGFFDYKGRFSLTEFEEFANEFKSKFFGVKDPSSIDERTIEKEFWRLVLCSEENISVLYGADLHSKDVGSGFPVCKKRKLNENNSNEDNTSEGHPTTTTSSADSGLSRYENSGWNLNNFPKLEKSILRHIGSNVSGMTQPWIYVGMVFSAFCWHTEDHWTPSINYLHCGSTKTWYGVPGSQATLLDQRVKEYVPPMFSVQPDLMHNLNTMVHPNEFTKHGIRVSRADQQPGEFIITFPRAYHAGFNQGFNIAEAVNFATSRWLRMGYESINHYVTIKRNNVFSHEEFLCMLALDPSELSQKDATEAYSQLSVLMADERQLYTDLQRLNVRYRKRIKMDEREDDARSCFHCSQTLYFSMISCSCRVNCAPKLRQSCRKHFKSLCRCAVSKRHFFYHYNLEELEDLMTSLYRVVTGSDINSTNYDETSTSDIPAKICSPGQVLSL